ncbi:MAG TPA: hypothetical protein DCM87_10885, partial [Planctomycetes bacterium]|nr:hypothetical protein [Planctomycetota bacterium]
AVVRSPHLVSFRDARGETMCAGVRLAIDGAPALPPESFTTEDATRLRTACRVSGRFDGAAAAFRYDARIIVHAGSARATILLTITHNAPRAVETAVTDVACAFELDSDAEEAVAGTERGAIALPPGGAAALTQLDDLGYRVAGPGGVAASGTRAPGWIAARTARGWTALGVRHFWQNHPKALFLEPRALGVRLWTGDAPLTWEGGLAKTHEIVLDFGAKKPDRMRLDPLRAAAPPAWVCGTQALGGPLLPRCREAIERFPYYEALREAGMRRWVRAMPFGFRHFGDAYLGGPWKGKNAYANLEYDVHFNFLLEHLRTGDPWYLSCAEAMARHQADIDTDHVTGQPWKHGPDHTTTEAELGHVFVRGLLLHYALTGETRSVETACRIGDWIASKMPRADDFNNERWVGWSLHALAGLFETTRDERYLAAARAAVAKLCAGQAPSGKLPLRYDNRIAFFNGIAMQGMLDVGDQTGDPAIAEAVARIAHRTFGMYPDYACRTLNAYARLARLTPDPRYLDTLRKTWESSMAFLMPRDAVTAATYAWQFPHAAARHGLLPLFDREPPPALSPAGWRAQRIPQAEIECYVRRTGAAPASILVILEGPATGAAALWDPTGRPCAERRFSDDARLFQPWTIAVPAGACRLRLAAESGGAWQLHHDAAAQIVFHDPRGAVLPWLFPAAAGFVREGAAEIGLTLEAMGEGFHTATLSSAGGEPLAALRRFVDRDDKGRYELVLAAPAGPPVVRIDVALANVIAIEGLLPYFAGSPEDLFNPERELRR